MGYCRSRWFFLSWYRFTGKVVRIGAIGLGEIGRLEYELLAEMTGVKLVGGADVATEAREAFDAAFDARVYDDHAALLAAEDLDEVNIATPHTFHRRPTLTALDRNLHVHLEKLLTMRVETGLDLVRTADDRDLVLQVGYQRRFNPYYREMHRQISNGRIGEVNTVTCHLGQNWLNIVDGTWRLNPELSGGGQLSDSGSHLLDMVLWITEATPGLVSGVIDDRGQRVDVNSALTASLDGPCGPIVQASGSRERGVRGGTRRVGPDGTLSCDGESLELLSSDSGRAEPR